MKKSETEAQKRSGRSSCMCLMLCLIVICEKWIETDCGNLVTVVDVLIAAAVVVVVKVVQR